MILDLEWNTAYSGKLSRYVNEIIEFGAVKLDGQLKVLSGFSSFVKPEIERKLRKRLRELCNISERDLEGAEPFLSVCDSFEKWLGDTENTVLMSWGDTDIRVLIDNFKYHSNEDPHIPFLSYYLDLQAYFMKREKLVKAHQTGLSDAAELLGIDTKAFVLHRALNDSELSAACLARIYEKSSFKEALLKADEEFYRKFLFKPYFVTDINDRLVDKSLFSCRCLSCGKQARRLNDFKLSANSFTADFLCEGCGTKYRVRVQFKKNYSQLNAKKSVSILSEGEGGQDRAFLL